MEVRDLITNQLIDLNFQAASKSEVFEKLAAMAYAENRVTSKEAFYEGLMQREKQTTTGFGDGMAIPHAKIPEVVTPSILIIKFTDPVEWESIDEEKVIMAISLAIPDTEAGNEHLKILSSLAGMLMDDEMKQALLEAKNSEELIELLEKRL